MRLLLALIGVIVISLVILAIAYRPIRDSMYNKRSLLGKSIHAWSEYNLFGLFIMPFPVLVVISTISIFPIIR